MVAVPIKPFVLSLSKDEPVEGSKDIQTRETNDLLGLYPALF